MTDLQILLRRLYRQQTRLRRAGRLARHLTQRWHDWAARVRLHLTARDE